MTNEKGSERNMALKEEKVEKSYGLGVRHLQIVCMATCMTVLFMARSSMGVAVLAMSDVKKRNNTDVTIYEWDATIQNTILSSFFWGYVVMQIPAGILSKKFGGKLLLLIALLASGLLCLLIPTFAALGGWPLVCVSRIVMGLTQACLFPATHTLLGQWLPPSEQTSYTGFVYGGIKIGTILSMPLSGILADTAMGWKSIFYTMAGLAFTTAVIWYFFTASAPKYHKYIKMEERKYIESQLNIEEKEKKVQIPWKTLLTSIPLLATFIPHIGFATSFIIFFVDMPMYMENALGITLRNSSILSALPYVGMLAGTLTASVVSQKLINHKILSRNTCRKLFNSIALFGLSMALILLSFLGPEQSMYAVVTLIIAMSLSGLGTAGFMMNQLDLSPNYAGVIISISNFIATIASIAMTLLASYIIGKRSDDVSGWRLVFLINATLCMSTNIVYLIFGNTNRQEWDDPNYLDKKKADPEEMIDMKSYHEKREYMNKKELQQ